MKDQKDQQEQQESLINYKKRSKVVKKKIISKWIFKINNHRSQKNL